MVAATPHICPVSPARDKEVVGRKTDSVFSLLDDDDAPPCQHRLVHHDIASPVLESLERIDPIGHALVLSDEIEPIPIGIEIQLDDQPHRGVDQRVHLPQFLARHARSLSLCDYPLQSR